MADPKDNEGSGKVFRLCQLPTSIHKKYAKIAGPLNRLTGKQPFTWGNEQQEAFDHLIEALTSTPVLTLPK